MMTHSTRALVAHLLAWPYVTGDSLIGGHARTKRRPKATRKHLRECRDGLADDRGVVALTGCVHDAEGQRGRASAAPRKDHAKPDSPCLALHGLKWSDDMPAVKPACSACWTSRSSCAGWNCSCEQ